MSKTSSAYFSPTRENTVDIDRPLVLVQLSEWEFFEIQLISDITIKIKFYQDQLEYSNRTMRKVYQRQHQVPFLPSIAQPSSKRQSLLPPNKNSKENVNEGSSLVQKFKMEPAHHCLAKRYSLRTPSSPSSPFENFLNNKLLEKDRVDTDVPTKPKGNRPWVAQELDLNRQTTKTSRIAAAKGKNNSSKILRRKSCHYNTPSSDQNLSRQIHPDKTTRIPRTLGCRAISLPRDKINSCKIAMKKGPFPMDQKKFERQKVADFFQDDCLSTINDRESEGPNLFMSFDSYLQIDF